ncbi:MAG: hypothetical protein GX567_11555 [Clostridia bacterium]|nr:hypothetical protein [Clostridia bacterium]
MSNNSFDANKEAQFGMLPVMKEERVYSLFDNSCINIGFAIATWCFLIGGTVSLFVDFWPAVIATLAGNMAAVLLMAMGTSVPSAKYGADNYTISSSYMGNRGKAIVMVFMFVFQVAWLIILSIMFGRAVDNVVSTAVKTDTMGPGFVGVMSIVSVAIVFLVVWRGPLVIRKFNIIVAPLLIITIIALLIILSKDVGWDVIVNAPPIAPFDSEWVNFLLAFELSLGAGLSWWPNMGGMARLCKTTRAAYWANLAGLILAASLGTAVGCAAAVTIGSSDPTEWMIPLGGVVLGVLALVFVAIANITSNAIVTYGICLGLKNFKFFRNKKWPVVIAIFCLPGIIGLILWPSQIYDNFYIMLGVTCTFYCPMVAINCVDYFLLRKQRLDVVGLYDNTKTSKYSFWKGFNWVAIVSFAAGMPFYLLFLNPATLVYQEPFKYLTASGASVIFVAILYFILAKLILVRNNIGGYSTKA